MLFYPVIDANFDTASCHQFAEGNFLRCDAMQWFWDQYTADAAQRAEITASPLRATVDQLRGLPPALVIIGEADVLRDEGEAYANKLREQAPRGRSAGHGRSLPGPRRRLRDEVIHRQFGAPGEHLLSSWPQSATAARLVR